MCHVLIIEDEVLIALDIQGMLEESGASSFAFASTESEAVEEALRRRPEFISSDVCLEEGFGSNAVATIHRELGYIPTMYVTATPENCHGCPSDHVLGKPLQEAKIVALFQKLAPI